MDEYESLHSYFYVTKSSITLLNGLANLAYSIGMDSTRLWVLQERGERNCFFR
jgi:hypothetical protein